MTNVTRAFVLLTMVLTCTAYEMYAVNGGPWGSWTKSQRCPGLKVKGFQLRVEASVGRGDDTALNAIALLCEHHATIIPHSGIWGSWGMAKYCPIGSHVVGFRLKVEGNQGRGDDTAANDLELKCSNGKVISSSNGGSWGSWGMWRQCDRGHFICGLRVKFEASVGRGDDTALNSVAFECCYNNVPLVSRTTYQHPRSSLGTVGGISFLRRP
ncbi:vitelline membrane outer layer protein 1-like [Lingula anatina]|uniref:Vitelline membrane outer layer protein 1-like n=1 Tax=Lingula anatina TaxID=7574 RepID=A0A1S3IY80_LINAN|nr:vitelline membrane outer layer protein 1-like [Lingula anatina]|eukprot:XP_013403157.1 vitelline membrane outer layer protein 1-like [Lingula anatina]